VLACFESIAAGRDVNINTAAAGGELPDKGSASLFALGVGVLLVAGGLLARRIFR
jgi:hypothetical protein